MNLTLRERFILTAWDAVYWGRWNVGCPKDRKSTRLNSSHANISYAVFCLKKKTRKYLACRLRLEKKPPTIAKHTPSPLNSVLPHQLNNFTALPSYYIVLAYLKSHPNVVVY